MTSVNNIQNKSQTELSNKEKNINDDQSKSMSININNIENEDTLPSHVRLRIFIMFLLANAFLNYDTGVLPASLLEIEKEIKLSYKEQALIGSLVYLGLSFASLFVSLLFNRFGPAKVCSLMILTNAICCFIFSFSYLKPVLFFCRFMMGVTEAFIVIYGPVWVNNFSPAEHSTKWMGILHSFSALGVVLGYIVAGNVIHYLNLSWRYAIQVQGIVEIPIFLYFWFENEEYINIDLKDKNKDKPQVNNSVDFSVESKKDASAKTITINKTSLITNNINISENVNNINTNHTPRFQSNTNNLMSPQRKYHTQRFSRRPENRLDTVKTSDFNLYCIQAKEVLSNYLYIWVCLGLCSMYFIVTGIQFWITSYLIDYLGNDPVQVIFIFSFISFTAPLSGVLIGSTFADKYGGYKGKNSKKALKLCSAFGLVAFIFAFPIGFLYSLIYISVLLWAFLFFGAAIVPVGTGIMVSSVNKDAQATSSSISQLIFNFFGYFLSPILTGTLMDKFENKIEGYKWGMRLIFWWSIFAAIFMAFALIVAINRYKKNKDSKDDASLVDDELGQNMGDLIQLEIMRRMAHNI